MPTFSFEFFPPKAEAAQDDFWSVINEYLDLDPKYMTVTYGAGGSTRHETLDIVTRLATEHTTPIASHLTFLSTPKPELYDYIDALWLNNVKHIVALRGDLPKGASFDDFKGDEYFDYTSNFVIALKERHDFFVSVGAYPEKHPDAPNMDADIHALWRKCIEADADQAITQFFFDNDVYYKFLDLCAAKDITKPIIPGILPIHNFKAMTSFAGRCGASVPQWLHDRFDPILDSPEECRKVALDLLQTQVTDLAANGIKHFHFYTLNKSDLTKDVCKTLKDTLG